MISMPFTALANLAADLLPSTQAQERELRQKDKELWSVGVSVSRVVPELETIIVDSDDGNLELCLSASDCPVPLHAIHEGQRLVVRLEGVLAPKVVQVSLAGF
jgi:hypothetical protein